MNDAEREVIGRGGYWTRCPTCERLEDETDVEYRSDDRYDVKREARDHREWHPDHRPIARGPDGERVYG